MATLLSLGAKKRVKQNNLSRQISTKPYEPFKLISVDDVNKARKKVRIREKYWKSGIGKEKLRVLKDKD